MRSGILVDDLGETWADSSAALSKKLGTERSGPDLIRYLVRNLGFVHIRPGATGCVVTLTEDAASQCALIGTLYWLMDNRPERVALQSLPKTNAPQRLLRYTQALNYISACCDAQTSRPRFSRHSVDMNQSPFAVRWETAKEVLASSDIADQRRWLILDKLLQSYFTVSRRDRESGRYIVEHIGQGISGHHPSLSTMKVGLPFSAIDDSAYGAWLDESFMSISNTSNPFSEYVEATIGISTSRSTRLQYSRLLLPFARETESYLLTASMVQ